MKLLLDTCTFLWLALEPTRLSPTAIERINEEENLLFLSEVSSWEIALKYTAQKLPLPEIPSIWVPSRRAFFGIEPLPIVERVIFRTCDLPTKHLDPFDRLLVAHANEVGLAILSPDAKLDELDGTRIW